MPSSLTLVGPESQSQHSAEQARAQLAEVVSKRRGDLHFAGVGGAFTVVRRGEITWAVERLNLPLGASGPLTGELELFRDADLAGVGATPCEVLPMLRGATRDSTLPRSGLVALPDRSALAAVPVAPLERYQASTPWSANAVDDNVLVISFGTGCNDNATVQLTQAASYVLVQVVRNGPASHLACRSGQTGKLVLDQPLGNRLLLHAVLRDLLPSRAFDRVPAYLPDGAVAVSDVTDHAIRTRVWTLPDGRTLTLYVGVRSPFDTPPEQVFVAGYEARFRNVSGHAGPVLGGGRRPGAGLRLSAARGRHRPAPERAVLQARRREPLHRGVRGAHAR